MLDHNSLEDNSSFLMEETYCQLESRKISRLRFSLWSVFHSLLLGFYFVKYLWSVPELQASFPDTVIFTVALSLLQPHLTSDLQLCWYILSCKTYSIQEYPLQCIWCSLWSMSHHLCWYIPTSEYLFHSSYRCIPASVQTGVCLLLLQYTDLPNKTCFQFSAVIFVFLIFIQIQQSSMLYVFNESTSICCILDFSQVYYNRDFGTLSFFVLFNWQKLYSIQLFCVLSPIMRPTNIGNMLW